MNFIWRLTCVVHTSKCFSKSQIAHISAIRFWNYDLEIWDFEFSKSWNRERAQIMLFLKKFEQFPKSKFSNEWVDFTKNEKHCVCVTIIN